jgi:hypothetical protein
LLEWVGNDDCVFSGLGVAKLFDVIVLVVDLYHPWRWKRCYRRWF